MKNYLKEFEKKTIVIVGDVMLDKYIFGNVKRISPEAPVPIVKVEEEKYVPGGAANAASNVSTLSGKSFLFGIVGNDVAKDILNEEAKNRFINTEGIISSGAKPTIQKIRVLGQNQQLLRIDHEDTDYIGDKWEKEIMANISKVPKIDAIIVSDYGKGTITKTLMDELKKFVSKNKIILVVDPKPKHKSFYNGVSLITPNRREAEEMSGILIKNEKDVEKAGNKLMHELDCDILITMGKKGMSLFEKKKKAMHIPTQAKEVFDVSGAGDTVIATLGLALSSGASLKDAAVIANHAAGVKVGKVGTAPVSIEELKDSL